MRPSLIWALLAVVGIASLALVSRSALACSGGGDFDAVRDSEVSVAGRVTSWERTTVDTGENFNPLVPIFLRFDVQEVWKGGGPAPTEFVDLTSLAILSLDGTRTAWMGGGGACGVFDEEPTGQYLILGLNHDPGGIWRPNRLLVFYRGEPEGQWYSHIRSLLRRDLVISAPAARRNPALSACSSSSHRS